MKMESELLKLAASQGIWTALSVALIFYILKNQEKRDLKQEEREKNYQDMISQLKENLNMMEEVRNDVEKIKEHLFKNKT
jgi:hypothetical protein